jgi:hypothetical protein
MSQNPEHNIPDVDAALERKRRDYIFLMVFMILSFIAISVMRRYYATTDDGMNASNVLSFWATAGWYVFMYRITSNFYKNRWVHLSYASLLTFQLIFNMWTHRDSHTAISSLLVPASIGYVANLVGFGIVFFILLKDVFSRRHDLSYALLGAANIYFMIPVIFTYFYTLVAIHDPSMVQADPLAIRSLLFNCFDYGWYVLAGIDPPGEKYSEIIRSISILESISANLFVVFIIGRLMTK